MKLVARFPLTGTPSAEEATAALRLRLRLELVERTDLACVLCTVAAPMSSKANVVDALMEPPQSPGPVVQRGSRWKLWLSPCSWLVLSSEEDEDDLVKEADALMNNASVLVSRYSDQFCWLELEGEGVTDAFRQGGFITFRPGGLPAQYAKRTLVAGIPVLIHVVDETRWRVGVERSRAQYFVDWLCSLDTRKESSNLGGDSEAA